MHFAPNILTQYPKKTRGQPPIAVQIGAGTRAQFLGRVANYSSHSRSPVVVHRGPLFFNLADHADRSLWVRGCVAKPRGVCTSSLRGRRSKGKGEGEFEREARSWDWEGSPPPNSPPTTHPHDRASRSNSPSLFPFERRPRRLLHKRL